MDDSILDLLAVRTLEVWLLQLGFQPTGDDSVTITDYGPHRTFSVQARIPDDITVDRHDLLDHLQQFLDKQASLPGAARFNAYGIELYYSPYCGGYVFASIEHTA